jgi:hypothetical protein
MSAFQVNPSPYYTFQTWTHPNSSVSAGNGQDSSSTLQLTAFGTLASENWQIYPQGGRYFLRNWDYAAKVQLGVTKDSPDTPRLMKTDGMLGQQWNIEAEGTGWRLVNGLWADGALAVQQPSGDGIEKGNKADGVWTIKENER